MLIEHLSPHTSAPQPLSDSVPTDLVLNPSDERDVGSEDNIFDFPDPSDLWNLFPTPSDPEFAFNNEFWSQSLDFGNNDTSMSS
jgi:hypothetical protein